MAVNKKKRDSLFKKVVNKKDEIVSGELITEDEIKENSYIDDNGKFKVPKDYTREFYKLDKDQLIHKIFALEIENEVLSRQIESLKKSESE